MKGRMDIIISHYRIKSQITILKWLVSLIFDYFEVV